MPIFTPVHSYPGPLCSVTMLRTRPQPKETFLLGPFTVPRVWVGLWQLSSNAWGSASAAKVRQAMARHVEMGYTSFGESRISRSCVFLYNYERHIFGRHGTQSVLLDRSFK